MSRVPSVQCIVPAELTDIHIGKGIFLILVRRKTQLRTVFEIIQIPDIELCILIHQLLYAPAVAQHVQHHQYDRRRNQNNNGNNQHTVRPDEAFHAVFGEEIVLEHIITDHLVAHFHQLFVQNPQQWNICPRLDCHINDMCVI